MRRYLGLENEKKEVSKEILEERDRKIEERKAGIVEIESKDNFIVFQDKDKEKEKEKVVGMDIETDDDDDDTNRSKPQLFYGTPTTTPLPIAPPTAHPTARVISYRFGMLKRPLTPPSASTTPSDTPLTDDGLISTEIIKPQVNYQSKDYSFNPRKFIKDEDTEKNKEKEKEKGDVSMEEYISFYFFTFCFFLFLLTLFSRYSFVFLHFVLFYLVLVFNV